MTHFQRIAAAFAAFALTLGGILVASTPAQAAPPSNCPNSSMCGYVNSGYTTGGGYEINPVRSNGVCENVAFNDAWSSIYNNSGKTVRFFAQANCAGSTSSSFTLANGSGHSEMSLSRPTFADEISSYRWGG
jgi:hypothetical protein